MSPDPLILLTASGGPPLQLNRLLVWAKMGHKCQMSLKKEKNPPRFGGSTWLLSIETK